ncbi:MAG TPA: hypothetical protein VJB93_01045, partial [Patescibacteria group bacterium]|nr:hypothetical protein [Patescibacteria group bacterium]
ALIQTSHDAIATTTTWNNLGSASEGLFLSYDATNNRGRIVSIETATAYRELVIAGSNMYFNTGTAGQTNALTIDSSQATTFTGVMTLSGGGGTASAAVPTIVLSGGEKTIDFGGNGQQLIGGNSAGQLFMARNVWWDAGNNVYRASRNDIGASVLIIGTDKQLYFQNAANATSVGDIVTPTTRFSVTDTDLTVNTGQITLSADTNFVLSGGTNGASFDTDVLSIDATNNRVGVGTTTPGVLLDVSQNQNGETYLRSINTTAGTSSTARIQAQSDGGSMYMRMHSSTFTTSNQYQANTGLLESNIGALVLSAAGALSIQFWTNSTQRLNINSSGYLGVSTTDFQDHAGTGDRNSQMVVTINDASTAWGDAIGALTLRNTNQTNNHWVKLNFAANDNNTVVGAAISAQTTDYTVTAWSTTDLVVHTGLKGAAPLERMRITGAGNVTMGSNITNGTTTMDIGGTTTTIALCHANADADDEQIVDCSGAPSDIAEWYDTRIGVEDGDVLIPTGEYREYEAEGSDYNGRIKSLGKQRISVLGVSQTAYQSNVVGVVSSGPWQIIGEDIKKVATNAKPVALAGRVPIKVTLENGAIAPGDLLVSSSTPGYAMKYDPAKVPQGTGSFAIIGTALESFAGEKGKVMAIIKSGYLSKERTLTIADKGGALIELHDTISVVNDRLRQLESQFATLVQRGVMNIGAIDSTGAFVSLKVIGDADIGGTLVIGKAVAQKYSCQDCAILRPGLLVYITKDKEVALASSAREKTVPAIGVVMGVEENQVIVAIGGSVDMFEGLIAGTRYYLAQEQGKITAKPTAVIRQIIGIAQSSTELLIQPNFEYRIEKQQPEKESVVMLK